MVGEKCSGVVVEGATGGTGPEFIHDGYITCVQSLIPGPYGVRPIDGDVLLENGICQFDWGECTNLGCIYHPQFDGFNVTYTKLVENSTFLGKSISGDGYSKIEVYETGDSLVTIVQIGPDREFFTKIKSELGEHDYKQMKSELLEALK